jgi:hypothetical protein
MSNCSILEGVRNWILKLKLLWWIYNFIATMLEYNTDPVENKPRVANYEVECT